MPAPKQFKPGPQAVREIEPVSRTVITKGRYSVVTPQAPIIDDPSVVEVAVDDVTVVMRGSKYEQRSLHAYGEVGDGMEEEPEAVAEIVPEPVSPRTPVFGEWRSESSLEGTHYHRKDSRRI